MAAEVLDYGCADGSNWGKSASELIAMYGATPVSRRAYSSAVHATSAQAVSASFGATQLATLQEIMLMLQGIGLMPTS